MTIAVSYEQRLSSAELAALAGLPPETPREKVTRAFLDEAARSYDLPDGSSPDQVLKSAKAAVVAFGKNLSTAPESGSYGQIMGPLVEFVGRRANRVNVPLMHGDKIVDVELRTGKNGGRASVSGRRIVTHAL